MRYSRYLIVALLIPALVFGHIVPVEAAPPPLQASAAFLMDLDTGRILYEQNSRNRRAPASTTKITTAIVALTEGNLQQVVTVSKQAANTKEAGINLESEEKITLKALLEALMVHSANDAAVAIAETVGNGRVDTFVEKMNNRAKAIGATDTHFVNPHGLDAPDHYSSAKDLALLARYAILEVRGFDELIRLKEITLKRNNQLETVYKNRNKLLFNYPGADGVKTGTTNKAGKCLVASATRGRHRLISVVLNSPDVFAESARLLDYGFNDFKYQSLVKAGGTVDKAKVMYGKNELMPLKVTETITAPLRVDGGDQVVTKTHLRESLEAPISANQEVGIYEIWINGQKFRELPLVTADAVHRQPAWQIWWSNLLQWLRNLRS